MTRKKKTYEHTLTVTFGHIGISSDPAKDVAIKLRFDRSALGTLEDVADLFTGAQLRAQIECDLAADKDAEGQETMDFGAIALELTVTTERFTVEADQIKTVLKVPEPSVEVPVLLQLRRHDGTLHCTRIGDASITPADDSGSETA